MLLMHHIALTLATEGWTLRSGGANGADQAFLSGAINHHQHFAPCIETYLPWPSYERDELSRITFGSRSHVALEEPTPGTFKIAAELHPAWDRCSLAARKLHARNVHQILGRSGYDTKSAFVVCWTPDGATKASETSARTGGTGGAIRLADAHGIEVRNLFNDDTRHAAEMWCMANRDTRKAGEGQA
jgi:hypothetical protein